MLKVDLNLWTGKVKRLNNVVKNKEVFIKKKGAGNITMILNRNGYISKLSKILKDISKILDKMFETNYSY